ncbi:HlyD family secretion protein [Sphingobacterium paucimobilis]|uniref:Uncharacterized protein n=1 Tax=Sphingobacterium paucimobilis HER1398 TaxID=1346330 RepID=U2J671_9SPHI|nr:efflux RND transporter periplasmic adaptor subunit [Sphingobacterium paucimobilis]ERJ58143.1 hypothetical protein M472_05130 [Sphingobacterium paucimobilis HER1398]
MNNIINKPLFFVGLVALLSYGCSSSENKESVSARSGGEILKEVKDIQAIGKVTPSVPDAMISSTASGQIEEVFVNEGDFVRKGDVLLQLDVAQASLDVEQAALELERLRLGMRATEEDITKAVLVLEERTRKYEVSKRLVDRDAETKEVLAADYSNLVQQRATLKALQQQLEAQRVGLDEQRVNVKRSGKQRAELRITATSDGVIDNFDAHLGQSVGLHEKLGHIVTVSNPIIEAEVDELFANSVHVGQEVSVYTMVDQAAAVKGELIYVSPMLSNKSIFYETANEAQDRRVRRVKIRVAGESGLVINTKVNCVIKVK